VIKIKRRSVALTRLLRGSPLIFRVQLFIFRLIFQDLKSTNAQKILSNHVLRCESLSLDKAVRLLALDFFFDDKSSALDTSSQTGIVSSLELLYQYSDLIREAAVDKAPWDSPWLSTLFQFEKDGERIRIRPGTFIYKGYRTRGSSSEPEKHQEHLAKSVSREEFTQNLSRLLAERLYSRIKDKDSMTSRLRLFDPCIQQIIYGSCRSDHSAPHQLDEAWFNRRARYHLQHIMILDNLYAFGLLDDFPARVKSQR
jgi:hypothetical protein